MATEKLYIAKLESGEEIGPAEQEALIKLAEVGTITATTMIRSKLIPEWNKAGNVDFLKAIIFKQQQAELVQIAQNKSIFKKIAERVTLTAPQLDNAVGLVKVKVENLPKPPPLLRILAGITDLVILIPCLIAIFCGGKYCLDNGFLTDDNAVYVTLSTMLVFYFAYFTLLISFTSQTFGQRFWGVFLIRANGKPFWMGRVFFFTLFLLPFGLFAPIFLAIGVKTYPELLTGTRLAKVLVKKKH